MGKGANQSSAPRPHKTIRQRDKKLLMGSI